MRPARLFCVVAALGAIAAGCSSGSSGAAKPGVVRVVAAENFWGDIARQIGGAHASVTSLISDPTADPHQYESDARNAAAVADANVVIVNGVGYDDFMNKLLSATTHRGRVVVNVQQVLGATADDANPHLWYDIPRVPQVVQAIASALAQADPNDRVSFAANVKTFDGSLAPLNQRIDEIKHKYSDAPVAYTERVPGYLLDAAGLSIATPPGFAQAIEDGNEPSPGDTQKMDDLFTDHRVRVLLYNAQATSAVTKNVEDLARRTSIPIVPVTETQPKNEPTYQSWQQHQLDALFAALGG